MPSQFGWDSQAERNYHFSTRKAEQWESRSTTVEYSSIVEYYKDRIN